METYKLKEGQLDVPKDETEIEVFNTEPIYTITLKQINEELSMTVLEMENLQNRKIAIEEKIVKIQKSLNEKAGKKLPIKD